MVGWCLPLGIVEKSLERNLGYLNREEERELGGHWIHIRAIEQMMLLGL